MAKQTINCGLNRPEFRGAHARDDFPNRDDKEWMKHSLSWLPKIKEEVRIGYRPVEMQPMSDEVDHVPPMKRVY